MPVWMIDEKLKLTGLRLDEKQVAVSADNADPGFALNPWPTLEARSPKFAVNDNGAFRFERYLNSSDGAQHANLAVGCSLVTRKPVNHE